jgi:hypothetical protein
MFKLLDKLKSYSKATMLLTDPTEDMLSIANCRSKGSKSFSKLQLLTNQQTAVDSTSDILSISLTQEDFDTLLKAIQSYKDGLNDFNVQFDSNPLWFW